MLNIKGPEAVYCVILFSAACCTKVMLSDIVLHTAKSYSAACCILPSAIVLQCFNYKHEI